MVSPSKSKYSRVAANQQQTPASPNKIKLVKGPRPLIHHCFYLDVQQHQAARKIEYTIKELGGSVSFFLCKEITHFITDRDLTQQTHKAQQSYARQLSTDFLDGGPSSHYHLTQQSPVTPTTPKTPVSHPYHHHLQQYVNEASPSSPCVNPTQALLGCGTTTVASGCTTPAKAAIGGSECKVKPTQPLSRADAMLQRARQQQNPNSPTVSNFISTSSRSGGLGSPCSPAPLPVTTNNNNSAFRSDRSSPNPAQLAKSWGKPIWSTEYAFKFLKKVILNCKAEQEQLRSLSKSSTNSRKGSHPQHLRGDFVKIESLTRNYRPAFQLFKKWPVLNLNTKSSASAFDSETEKQPTAVIEPGAPIAVSNKTVKDTNGIGSVAQQSIKTTTATTNATANKQTQRRCGYCEICKIEYDVLANHLISEEHCAFVNDESNFVLLDKLICEGGVNLETFMSKQETLLEEESVVQSEIQQTIHSEIVVSEECKQEEKLQTVEHIVDESGQLEVPIVARTYSRKLKDKNSPNATADIESIARRTYAGRKPPRRIIKEVLTKIQTAQTSVSQALSSSSITAAESQMFGRRSAIYHHPHNTLNHHNHQKAKTAKLIQQAILNSASELAKAKETIPSTVATTVTASTDAVEITSSKQNKDTVIEETARVVATDEMKVLNDSASNEKEKDRQSKRSAADRMGLKGSTIKPVHNPVDMIECEGLDPKNTKRISLGLRQNPKRANLNEDFTSLLDETLGPMRKPRIKRETIKRVNYSEPREDEIVSQEEIMQTILENSAKETKEDNKKKKPGSPKSAADVKIRGIRWRAPSPQARPPVKSPLLYKVIEEPKAKGKKMPSPTKETNIIGTSSKPNKNGIIVKIRRVRQSELSLLNDEAENFMFPKKDESSEEDTDEDRQTTSENTPGDLSQEVLSSDYDHRNSSMRKSAGTPSRKRTPAPGKPATESPPCKKIAVKEVQPEPSSTPSTAGKSRRVSRGVNALLNDNTEYYKFQDPGSRLRFPEAPIQPGQKVEDDTSTTLAEAATTATPSPAASATTSSSKKRGSRKPLISAVSFPVPMSSPSVPIHSSLARASTKSPYEHQEQLSNCGKKIINFVKGKEDGMGVFRWSNFRKNCKLIEPYRFAFERVPSLEPWYEAFQRQDECCEKMYEYFGNTAYRKLPYEMGLLPPLKPNCCILNYRLAKAKSPEESIPTSCMGSSNSSSSSSTSSCTNSITTTMNASFGTTTTGATSTATSVKIEDDDKQLLSLPLKKRKLLVDSERPRKSPREHASTLAILSLLHQQQQHNRRRTFSGSSSGVPFVTAILPPPSPINHSSSSNSPKKNQQQEVDSALGDEIRSSCGSDPITEKEVSSSGEGPRESKKIKFDPPVLEDSFVNYRNMCQQWDDFLNVNLGDLEDELLRDDVPPPSSSKTVPIALIGKKAPWNQNLTEVVQACDKEPPLTLKYVCRQQSIVRKIVQYDRKPRALGAISVKSFDGGGGSFLFRKRINRTGWPNVKKRIVTRKQQLLLKVKKDGEGEDDATKKLNGSELVEGDGSRKSSTEESQVSGSNEEDKLKQEDEDEDIDEDDDEFEDTMTMLDDDDHSGKMDQILTEDEEELGTPHKLSDELLPPTPVPIPPPPEEVAVSNRVANRPLLSGKYVTKTTTTMTRVDYNVPATLASNTNANITVPSVEDLHIPNQSSMISRSKGILLNATVNRCVTPPVTLPTTSTPNAVTTTSTTTIPTVPVHNNEDDDKECDSISSRSIFVSDDCDTTSSTLINMCTDDPLPTPGANRNSETPQPTAPPEEPPDRPTSQARVTNSNSRHPNSVVPRKRSSPVATMPGNRSSSNLQPIVCIERLNCSSMRTRSSSRTPVKTYKRSIFTSALVNSSGKPLKRKRKKKHKLNGTSSSGSAGTSTPTSCSDELNSVVSSPLDCEDESPPVRKSVKNRPPTPGPAKFSPRKLRKPRGRWYRER